MYVNLAALFDNRKDAPSLLDCIKSNKTGKEAHKAEDLKKLEAIIEKHEKTINKVIDIRNKAVAHISNDLMVADLNQDSMEVQVLIKDLLDFFNGLESMTIDTSTQNIHDNAPKIRDDLGQRELWNSKHGEMMKEIFG